MSSVQGDTLSISFSNNKAKNEGKALSALGNICIDFLFFLGILTCLLSMFHISCNISITAGVGAIVIISLHLARGKRWIYACTAVFFLLITIAAVVMGLKTVENGMILTVNQVLDTIGLHTGVFYNQYEVIAEGNSIFYGTVFMSIISIILAYLSTLSLRVLMIAAILIVQVYYGIYPNILSGFLLIFGCLFMIGKLFQQSMGHKFISAGRSIHTVVFIFGSILFCILAFILGLMLFFQPAGSYQKSERADNIKYVAIHKIEDMRYEKNPTNNYPKGDFTRAGDLVLTENTALEVTMDQPTSLYLRGYIGSQYTKNRWMDLDNKVHYDNKELFYWLHQLDFYGLNQLSQVYRLGIDQQEEKNLRIQIENINANSKYLYTPYELTTKQNTFEGAKSKGDSNLISSNFFGDRSYSYESEDNVVRKYTDVASNYYQIQDQEQAQDYVVNESHYNAYIYENYTKIPEDVRQLLQEELGELGEYYSHMPYEEAQEHIITYLKDNLTYSEEIGKKPKDMDFLEFALKQDKKGYGIHYATAAALMYRYVGIPARYVEGYLITPEDVEGKEGESTLDITGENAHAWVEIYQDGLGWIPIEVTPAYADVMERANTGAPSPQEVPEESGEEPETSTEVQDRPNRTVNTEEEEFLDMFQVLKWVLLALFIALILTILYFTIKKRRMVNQRKAKMDMADNKKAIHYLFEYLMMILHWDGIQSKGGSFYDYTNTLSEKYSTGYGKKFEKVLKLQQKAVYSHHELSDGDRDYVKDFVEQSLSMILLSKKIWQRFWLKFKVGLY